MSRLLAVIANDPQRIRCALHPGRHALRLNEPPASEAGRAEAHESREPDRRPASEVPEAPAMPEVPAVPAVIDSWGFGFHQGGEVLLQRRPRPAGGPLDFYQLLGDLRTDVLVGHFREATVGTVKNENTHPFRFRQWLFAHHGTIGSAEGDPQRFEAAREALQAQLPDFLRRNLRGETDSEHLFHLFLGQLQRAARIDDPLVTTEVAGRALAEAVALCDAAVGGDSWAADCVASNGRILLGMARGAPMHCYQVTGLHDCPVCHDAPGDAARAGGRSYDHDHLRAVVLIADDELEAPRPPWREVPPGSLVTVSHDLQLRITPLVT